MSAIKSISKRRERWSRDETLLALKLYYETPFGRIHDGNKDIQRLAAILSRTTDALVMKMGNLASFDPVHQERGVVGLRKASRLDKELAELYRGQTLATLFRLRIGIEPNSRQHFWS